MSRFVVVELVVLQYFRSSGGQDFNGNVQFSVPVNADNLTQGVCIRYIHVPMCSTFCLSKLRTVF